ncbi:MAG: methionine adenosyltransferase [bacterium]|nr:methionine adenosyltransferase [bacterium]MXV91397.1 methionine adenosyltransferase [Acidimicrobiia bacterium]MYC45111.1 methionine adenosyltransferase [Acidimicrobiia bacterium]
MSPTYIFTSESVTEGHPDKMADQISDAILDALIAKDPHSRVACETFLTSGLCVVGGEIRTEAWVDIPAIVRETICGIGYDRSDGGFDGKACGVLQAIGEQSPAIAEAVDRGEPDDPDGIGAGDSGLVFGFACTETDVLMPLPINLAHRLAERLAEMRRADTPPYLRPDGKVQVSVRYEGTVPVAVETVVASVQHADWVGPETLEEDVCEHVVRPVLEAAASGTGGTLDVADPRVLVNPAGRFVTGGPTADAGLTGRKIIVDTYGGMARHGGGAFSGKDPTKVDRSGSYAARWAAKNLVAAGAVDRCEIQVSYAIGKPQPVSLMVDAFGTHHVDPARLAPAVREVFDLRPAAIIRELDLLRPIYGATAAYGHFGRERDEFTWERTDRVHELRSELGL